MSMSSLRGPEASTCYISSGCLPLICHFSYLLSMTNRTCNTCIIKMNHKHKQADDHQNVISTNKTPCYDVNG